MKELYLDPSKTVSYQKHLSFTPEVIKEIDDGSSKIIGYASTFGNEDYMNDVMVKGCFSASIMEKQGKWPVLLNHETSQQIGMNLVAKETGKGLYVESTLYTDEQAIPKAKTALALIKKAKQIGHPMGLSIGGFVKKIQPEYEEGKGWKTKILDFSILEHSVTPIPANPKALVTQTKTFNYQMEKMLNEEENQEKLRLWNGFNPKSDFIIDFLKCYRESLNSQY